MLNSHKSEFMLTLHVRLQQGHPPSIWVFNLWHTHEETLQLLAFTIQLACCWRWVILKQLLGAALWSSCLKSSISSIQSLCLHCPFEFGVPWQVFLQIHLAVTFMNHGKMLHISSNWFLQKGHYHRLFKVVQYIKLGYLFSPDWTAKPALLNETHHPLKISCDVSKASYSFWWLERNSFLLMMECLPVKLALIDSGV